MISMKLLRGAAGMNHSVTSTCNIFIPSLSDGQDDTVTMRKNPFDLVSIRQATTLSALKKVPKMPAHLLEAEACLPTKPKKPVTPWLAFLHEKKDDVVLKNGPMTASQLASHLANEWRTIDKTKYQLEFKHKLENYHRAVESYRNSLSDEQRAVIEYQKNLKKESKELKKLRSTKLPTLPRNPINIYCSERSKDPDIKDQMKTRKAISVLRDLFQEYRHLSDFDKEKYVGLQKKDRLRFEHEFNEWYENVMSDSNLSETIRDKAKTLRARFQNLSYI